MLRRVWLSREEEQGYYYGFSNEGLWPLCHIAHTRPDLPRGGLGALPRRSTSASPTRSCEEVDADDPIVLVQDYHFALAPQLIRERLPRATILTFWHIPWPNAERFGICPWRDELLEGLLGSSILGFHTQLHCNNFLDVGRPLPRGARSIASATRSCTAARRTLVRPYPISIEWPNPLAATAPPPRTSAARRCSRELGLAPDALLGVGVDRLDYTKGIEERLLAVERLLERFPEFRGRFTFVQLAAPSRTEIDRYRELERPRGAARRAHQRALRQRQLPPDRPAARAPRAARASSATTARPTLCYVSSLHDGMNLVAKEFVAARDDERGVLVLSQFTGAARELTEALIVNPYDLDEASAALAAALRDAGRGAARAHARDARARRRVQRLPLGGAHAASTPRGCAGATASPTGSAPVRAPWKELPDGIDLRNPESWKRWPLPTRCSPSTSTARWRPSSPTRRGAR